MLAPPHSSRIRPKLEPLYAGTTLYRIHSKAYDADAFNPVPSHPFFGGGRFDSTSDDKYSYLYAGDSLEVAVAETLLRDYPFDALDRKRILPRAKYKDRRISALEVVNDLEVVSLTDGAGLAAVRQSSFLVNCGPDFYAQTRHWGHWIRSHSPTAQGYVWHSRFEPSRLSYVLFGDRHLGRPMVKAFPAAPGLPPGDEADFDTIAGRRKLNHFLGPHHAVVSLK